jgi:hypothetical protein
MKPKTRLRLCRFPLIGQKQSNGWGTVVLVIPHLFEAWGTHFL